MGLSLPKKPRQTFWDKVKDVADANSQADQYRRAQAGQPIQYRDQQAQRKTTSFNQPTRQVPFGVPQPAGNQRSAAPQQPPKPQVEWNQPTNPVALPKQQATPQLGAGVRPIGNQSVTKEGKMTAEDYRKDAVARQTKSISLGVGRSLTGTAQSLAGLFDAVSPGKGTSQATKNLNRNAEGIDKQVKELGLNNALYKTGQIGTDIATFLVPGATAPKLVAKGAKFASKAPGAAKVAKGVRSLEKGGKGAKATAAVAKYAARPDVIANVTTDAALNTGYRSARGQDISPGTIALDAGMSFGTQGALTGTGKAIKAGVNKLGDKLISDDVLVRANLPTGKKAVSPGPSTANPQSAKPIVKPTEKPNVVKSNALEDMADEAQAVRDQYKEGIIQRVKASFKRNIIGTTGELTSLEKQKYSGMMKSKQLADNTPTSQRADVAYKNLRNVGSQVDVHLKQKGRSTGVSLDDLQRQYYEGTPAQKQFFNYLNARQILEIRAKDRLPNYQRQYSDDVLNEAIKEYEVANPNAVRDAQAMKEAFDDQLDRLVEAGRITKQMAEDTKAAYSVYSPKHSVTPEGLERASATGGIGGSSARQKAVMELQGGSSPLDDSWDGILSKFAANEKEVLQTKFGKLMVQNVKEGRDGYGKLVIDGEKVSAYRTMLQNYRKLVDEAKSLSSKKRTKTGQTRIAGILKKQAEFSAAKTAKKELIDALKKPVVQAKKKLATTKSAEAAQKQRVIRENEKMTANQKKAADKARSFVLSKIAKDDVDAIAAVRSMKPDELIEVLDNMIYQGEKGAFGPAKAAARPSKQTPKLADIQARRAELEAIVTNPDAKKAIQNMDNDELLAVFDALSGDGKSYNLLRTSLQNKSSKHAALTDELDQLKQAIADNDATRASSRTDMNAARGEIEFTGRDKNILSTVIDGERYAIEVPPALAKDLAAASSKVQKAVSSTLLDVPARVFKVLFTGFASPVWWTINTFIKNPSLVLFRSDGLSAYGIRPILQGLQGVSGKGKFGIDNLQEHGANKLLATKGVYDPKIESMMRGSKGFSPKAFGNKVQLTFKHPVKSLGQALHSLDALMSLGDKGYRAQLAAGKYYRIKRLHPDMPEDELLKRAALEYNESLGDFNNVTNLMRGLEPIFLYSGATQAGARAHLGKYAERPLETALKATAMVVGVGALVNHNMDQHADYYESMIADGRSDELDRNIIITTPATEQNKETGEWTGIIKIGVVPDMQALNRMAWRTAYSMKKENKIDGKLLVKESINYATADTARRSVTENPTLQTGRILSNNDPRTGKAIESEYVRNQPLSDRKTKNTSGAAISLSNIGSKVGVDVSPLKVDRLLDQASFMGDVAQNKDEKGPIGVYVSGVKKSVGVSKGASDGSKYYKSVETNLSKIKNEDDFRIAQAMSSKNSERTAGDSAAKAKELFARPTVLEFMKNVDADARKRGDEGDPFFDLTPEQQKKVLVYRGAKDLNSAKQAYDKDGKPLFTSLGLDEKWYSDFRDKEDARYANIKAKNPSAENTMLTYSGAARPNDPKGKALETAYFALPKGAGRKAFLSANPGLLDYWAKGEQFSNAERIALGLEVNTTDDKYGGKGGYGSGGGGNKGVGSAFGLKAYPSGGGAPKPKATIKQITKLAVSSKKIAKPKVKITKSKV